MRSRKREMTSSACNPPLRARSAKSRRSFTERTCIDRGAAGSPSTRQRARAGRRLNAPDLDARCARRADAPNDAEDRQRAKDVIRHIDFPPQEALSRRRHHVMMIVVPPLAEREDRDESVIARL